MQFGNFLFVTQTNIPTHKLVFDFVMSLNIVLLKPASLLTNGAQGILMMHNKQKNKK